MSGQKRTVKKRRPGSARARESKRKQQEAARNRVAGEYEANWDAAIARLGPPPATVTEAFGYAWRAMLFALHSALTDKGLSPEVRREQAARISPQLIKALEPSRLAEQLERYEHALQELLKRGVSVNSPENGGARPTPSLS